MFEKQGRPQGKSIDGSRKLKGDLVVVVLVSKRHPIQTLQKLGNSLMKDLGLFQVNQVPAFFHYFQLGCFDLPCHFSGSCLRYESIF
jgi:hypothetical protein